ncbi:hypothetical protein D3C81_1194920 [compost metagenome]
MDHRKELNVKYPDHEMLLKCQPNYDNFVARGKQNDHVYQAIVHLGNASSLVSWATTVLREEPGVPECLKELVKSISPMIHSAQEALRPGVVTESESDSLKVILKMSQAVKDNPEWVAGVSSITPETILRDRQELTRKEPYKNKEKWHKVNGFNVIEGIDVTRDDLDNKPVGVFHPLFDGTFCKGFDTLEEAEAYATPEKYDDIARFLLED